MPASSPTGRRHRLATPSGKGGWLSIIDRAGDGPNQIMVYPFESLNWIREQPVWHTGS